MLTAERVKKPEDNESKDNFFAAGIYYAGFLLCGLGFLCVKNASPGDFARQCDGCPGRPKNWALGGGNISLDNIWL